MLLKMIALSWVICRIFERTLISTNALVWQWVEATLKLGGVFMLVARTYRVCASLGLQFDLG